MRETLLNWSFRQRDTGFFPVPWKTRTRSQPAMREAKDELRNRSLPRLSVLSFPVWSFIQPKSLLAGEHSKRPRAITAVETIKYRNSVWFVHFYRIKKRLGTHND